MQPRAFYNLPVEKEKKLQKAKKLEWTMISWQLTVVVVMYLAMGSSQAMKTAWVDDMLVLVPPLSFLLALKIRNKAPNENFPYGYSRAPLLSFLISAVAIFILGAYILIDSILSLIAARHPTLGHFDLFGSPVWSGWVMLGALFYSSLPSVILGRLKLPLAKDLHEKTLEADASMNKADWMTNSAAAVGVVGIGFGLWWMDAVAAIFIALNVIKDGLANVKNAVSDLMGRRPTQESNAKPLDLDEKIEEKVTEVPGVSRATVRLRESGHVVSGEVFVQLEGQDALARKIQEIAHAAEEVDWRLYNITVMPVADINKF